MWLVKKLLPLPEGPRINLFLLVMIPFLSGSSEMSVWIGLPVSLSPRRMPVGESEEREEDSRFKKQLACSAKLSKLSFMGKSASLPGIPAQKICGAPADSSLGTLSICASAEEIMLRMSLSLSGESVQASMLKCALTGNLPSLIASFKKSFVASLATRFSREYAESDCRRSLLDSSCLIVFFASSIKIY